jgi:hypothetical protein
MPISDDEEDDYKSEELGRNDAEISKFLIIIENSGVLILNISSLHISV